MSAQPPIPESAFYGIELYPERIDFDKLTLRFCPMSRDSYRESAFLDHRMVRAPGAGFAVPFESIDRLADLPATPVTHAVFHNAFCCSTLLSRHIDALGLNLVLREPHAIYELLVLRLMQGSGALPEVPPARIERLLALLRYLLGRRDRVDQPVIIKHTDGGNIGMQELLAETPGNRGLFLWSSLERFLSAILKLPQRRQWAYVRLQELLLAWRRREGALPLDPRPLQPHQAAALLWILQMDNVERTLAALPPGSLASLDAQTFLADPAGVLQVIMRHFGTVLARPDIEDRLRAANFETHAKSAAERYDSTQREDDFSQARAQFAPEIEAGLDWAGSVLGRDWRDYRPPMPLAQPDLTRSR